MLPADIIQKLREFHECGEEFNYIESKLLELWKLPLTVGPDQLARSILVLSDGDVTIVKDIFESGFYGDPRDVITRAESKLGNPGHYFIKPFRVNK